MPLLSNGTFVPAYCLTKPNWNPYTREDRGWVFLLYSLVFDTPRSGQDNAQTMTSGPVMCHCEAKLEGRRQQVAPNLLVSRMTRSRKTECETKGPQQNENVYRPLFNVIVPYPLNANARYSSMYVYRTSLPYFSTQLRYRLTDSHKTFQRTRTKLSSKTRTYSNELLNLAPFDV